MRGDVPIYILGPSAVGKSNAVQLLCSEEPELAVVDLDEEFQGREFDRGVIGRDLRYSINRRAIAGAQ